MAGGLEEWGEGILIKKDRSEKLIMKHRNNVEHVIQRCGRLEWNKAENTEQEAVPPNGLERRTYRWLHIYSGRTCP